MTMTNDLRSAISLLLSCCRKAAEVHGNAPFWNIYENPLVRSNHEGVAKLRSAVSYLAQQNFSLVLAEMD